MSQNNSDYLAREKFEQRIAKGMIGPGSDTWGLPDEEEIISNDTPLQRYFSGILFPDKDLVSCTTQSAIDDAEIQSQSERSDIEEETQEVKQEDDDEKTQRTTEPDEDRVSKTNFFPTNIGLSMCLPSNETELDLSISFGLYYQPANKDVKIKISEEGYRSFLNEKIPYQLPFKEILKYENGFMFLERGLKGNVGGKKKRSEEFLAFDQFRKNENLKDSSAKYFINYLERLINIGRIWKRKDFKIQQTIPIKNTAKPVELSFESSSHPQTKIGYNVKVVKQSDRQYVKVQLVNISKKHPANSFSNRNENLNLKSIFQAEVKVSSNNFLPYKQFNSDKTGIDEEAKELEFIYRSVENYAIGHNCSTYGNENHTEVKTTFLPVQNIKDVTNTFGANDAKLQNTLDLRNLSVWGLDQNQVIDHLNYFVNQYGDWISGQVIENQKENSNSEIGSQIILRQKQNFDRLKSNILLLDDPDIFRAYQIANTAMYIQLIISNDINFGNTEKELSEASTENLKDLDFFKNYDAQSRKSEGKIPFIPSYRPFQLAFLLLNIEGIVNPESDDRTNIVDLIWFPTGGGKTEAYLAVTAFTIAFRRLSNETGYEGTTVIMRYTLRLLTAQQFERASKLITTLEFLRKQADFKDALKDEPITIGLWVGMSSTPNKLKDAKSQIEEIDKECEKRNRKKELIGNPEEKNTFQINSCPWCGTKLVTKKIPKGGNLVWTHGFKEAKSDFKISCNNSNCTCSEKIPVQVVDELLYENPPTLLFGTVDKFAMLSWQDRAHQFFNSLDSDKLPPDLIIQDELHLLSGPLGSITGIFESIIEILSTKEKRTPKIIASTATTRNTEHQVQKLYGNRKVNIFPPSGINHDNSFFAREESSKSKRRYLGFMPTGKTNVDTQLQILAHLLVARMEVFTDKDTKEAINNYWTVVSYYNSLKDVGRTFNKVGDEVSTFTSTLQYRLASLFGADMKDLTFNYFGLSNRTKELTSRIESNKIKSVLNEIERTFNQDKIERSAKGNTYINNVVDFVLATNMISVGIDISRLNVMLINGIPKNIAEYIQASSRVGRRSKGLVISLMNPNRAREKSYFEHFNNFHQAFYKSVEPISITPFTENTIEKMLSSLIVSYVRNKVPGMAGNKDVVHFQKEMIDPLKEYIKQRFPDDEHSINLFEKHLDNLAYDWIERIQKSGLKEYKELLKRPDKKDDNQDWVLMTSMREIDSNTFISIKETF
jgi:superfamily II DNA/RNA helicase